MDIDAERDALIKILQRALRSVPFVKLDAVEDVMALFESGLSLLEANLIDIADLPASTTSSHSHPSDSISSQQQLPPSSSLSGPVASSDDGSSGRRPGLSLNVPSGQPFRDPLVSPGGTESAASLILRDDHDDVEARANSNHQSINAAVAAVQGRALDESAIKTVANRALLGVTVTRDYSSPRSSARSLSVSSASTNGPPSAAAAAAALQATAQQASTHKKLGLGLKSAERDKPAAPPAASAAPPAEVPVQQQPARGMSSRATSMTSNVGAGLRGKLGLGSTSSSSTSSTSSSTSSSSAPTGTAPAASVASGGSTPDDEASSAPKVAKPLPKHVLNRISGSSKEFPSPKLGGRSLGGLAGASSSSSSSSSAATSLARSTRSPANTSDDFEAPPRLDADESMSMDEDKLMTSTALGSVEGEDDEPVSSGISSSTEGQSDDAEAADDEMPSCSSAGGEDDLLLKPRSKGPLAKIRDNVALPVTASPKQIKSSLALVALATSSANSNGSAVNPDADLVGPADPTTKPSFSTSTSFDAVSSASVQSHASILRENLSSSSSFSNSPKPAFLRRLDSPNTQYSKLMQAKIKLQSIINKAISEAPRMKASSAAEIRSAFEKAVNKLESSTTVTQANTDLKPLPL